MGFELPDGKTARNIQDQVKFLTEKLKDLYAAFNQSGLKKIEIVEELPEVGSDTVLYLVPKEDPETGNYYDEYLWIDNQWEFIGSTQIDLSGYVTLNTDQTITAVKTFNVNPKLNGIADNGGTNRLIISSSGIIYTNANFKPYYGNNFDLGDSSYAWKDLYLSGKLNFDTGYSIEKSGSLINLNVNNAASLTLGSTTSAFGTNVRPTSNATMDLGSSSYAWKDLYLSGQINFSTNSSIRTAASGFVIFQISGYDRYWFTASSIKPHVNNAYDLGDSSDKWRNAYIAGNLSDGTNTVSIAEIGKVKTINNVAPDASGNVAVSATNGLYLHEIIFSNGDYVRIVNASATQLLTETQLDNAFPTSLSYSFFGNKVIAVALTAQDKNIFYYYNSGSGTIEGHTEGSTVTISSDTVSVYS